MDSKTLNVENPTDLLSKVPDVQVYGDPHTWVVVSKASSVRQGWMKTTKYMRVGSGRVYQMETQQTNPDGSYALSQSSVFVPEASGETRE